MKRHFGSILTRWLRGGVSLTDFEWWVLDRLVSELPLELRRIVEAQFQQYVLVQREVDGRALNFYPRGKDLKQVRNGVWSLPVPLLPMKCEVAPLMKVHAHVKVPMTDLHAVLGAVSGRAFSISFSEDVRRLTNASGFEVKEVTHAWRSNFSTAQAQQALAGDARNARA